MPLRIEDYAMIGDCQTAALVGRNGSIDWLCFPRFDSPACFAALLGSDEQGHWQISPAGEVSKSRRRYLDGTLILETRFETDSGEVALIDFMPPRGQQPDVVRIVRGLRGEVRMNMELVIRFDYGSIVPWVHKVDHGLMAIAGPDTLHLYSPVAVRGKDLKTVAEFVVTEGDETPFVLTWHRSHEAPHYESDALGALNATQQWWKTWSSRCQGNGPYDDAIRRSLITLKALTYSPTGGIVAAATTSLPEKIGGVRNWDYRFCWLRDATFSFYALLNAGYRDEAEAWRDWLLRAVAGTPAKTQIMYGLAGERRLTEYEVSWLPGYENSAPVRIGNAASEQFQLDVYGEVLDLMYQCRRHGMHSSSYDWSLERALVEFVATAWKEPDEGIWEVRGPRQHFTHSKVMAWVAVDRAVKAIERFGRDGPLEKWRKLRSEVHAEVCSRGFDPKVGAFVQHYGAKTLDASLLMIPLLGFLPVADPRVQGTIAAIQQELVRDGLVLRYPTETGVDGLPPGEGVFLPCSFWLADNLVLSGRMDEGREIFERLLGLTNDVGLISEEYDPTLGRLVGNFPQAFTHVTLVNTARNLSQSDGPAHDRQQG
jgi:GH15 family glucan-1,4-alpha-glucosidase